MALTEVVYKIRNDSFLPCAYTATHPDVRIVLSAISNGDDSTLKALVTVIGSDLAAQELTKSIPSLFDASEIVRETKEQTTLRVSVTPETLRRTANPLAFAIENFGEDVILMLALVRDGYMHTRLVASGRVDLAGLLSAYETGVKAGRWTDFKLIRLDDFDPEQQIHGAFSENLTQKQLEVIKTALALGFYNTPRSVTLDDLSNIFGISKAAVHNRLQAAERKVVSKFFA